MSVIDQIREVADLLCEILADARNAEELAANEAGHRCLIDAHAGAVSSARLYEAQAEGQVPDGAHASTAYDGEEPEDTLEPDPTPSLAVTALAADGREHMDQVRDGPRVANPTAAAAGAGSVPVVCAWKKGPTCQGHIRGPKPTGDPQEWVSHGMCVPCFTVISHEQAQERAS
jgi:hypothetical protein